MSRDFSLRYLRPQQLASKLAPTEAGVGEILVGASLSRDFFAAVSEAATAREASSLLQAGYFIHEILHKPFKALMSDGCQSRTFRGLKT